MKVLCVLPSQGKAIASQPDGWGDHAFKRKLAIFLLGIDHSRDRTWHPDRSSSYQASVGNHVALRVEIHVSGGSGRSFFTIVDEAGTPVRQAEEHEPAAAKVS